MRTVAVYAEGDAAAPFVREASEAILLGGRSASETYLNVDAILAAARRSGADAIHPGYGFLSENAAFARAVTDASLIWVGPAAEAIASMGDKLAAKRLMQEAGVPTLPWATLGSGEDAQKASKGIGYPLLVKAAAGGGGRGMRVVESVDELEAAIESARREALGAFGDDTIFLERWLATARHVEIQVVGDAHGNLVHCFERECSIQRRHQKIIEEAPSPAVDEALREKMGAAAIAAAGAIGYTSTGTVEFLLESDQFWFLEMNTRLQVEHPVTEAICGLDLVREQLRIAQGERLGFEQSDLRIDGHAVEARIYAEDPANDFLPATGTVLAWEPPASPEARVDSGVEAGSVVGTEFDPLLAKVIVHAPTRREASMRLARVLESTRIHGLTTNRDFLVATLRDAAFQAGETTTDFIERAAPARVRVPSGAELRRAAIAVAMGAQCERRAAAPVLRTFPSGWRNSMMPPEEMVLRHGETELTVRYRAQRDGSFTVECDGSESRVTIGSYEDGQIVLEVDGYRSAIDLLADGDVWYVHGSEGDVELTELPRFPVRGVEAVAGGLVAPMPGKVVEVLVTAGSQVQAGDLLLVLEAMKMEHRITASVDGVVIDVLVSEGEQVDNGQLLVVLSDGDESESGTRGK